MTLFSRGLRKVLLFPFPLTRMLFSSFTKCLSNIPLIYPLMCQPRGQVPLSPYWSEDSFCPFRKLGSKPLFQCPLVCSSRFLKFYLRYRMGNMLASIVPVL